MKPVVTPEEMGACDRAAIEAGTPGVVLMDRAGMAVAKAAVEMMGSAYGRRVEILCGKGNNGGDGFAATRHLQRMGAAPRLALLDEATSGDALDHLRRLERLGIPLRRQPRLEDADLVVDALFGTGLRGGLRDEAAAWAAKVNGSGRPVLSVDIPSGVEGATGRAEGEAVRARRTVTMAALKVGLVVGDGPELAGDVDVADIGIPVPLERASWLAVDDEDAARWRPRRARDTHKWAAGSVLVIAGSPGMTGAGILSASTALRAGAGLVVLAVPAEVLPSIEGHPDLTEVMTAPHEQVAELLPRFRAVAVGPGLRVGHAQKALVELVLDRAEAPVVVDADGLNNITPDHLRGRGRATVITPHAGELARLAGHDVEPLDEVPALAEKWKTVLLLKGSTTVIATPDGRRFLNLTGRPDLATAGTGDVLTGLVASLLAQGLEPWKATALGAYEHGLAGRGITHATEVRDAL